MPHKRKGRITDTAAMDSSVVSFVTVGTSGVMPTGLYLRISGE